MAFIRSITSIALLLAATAFIAGCTSDSEADAQDTGVPPDYSHYRNGYISLAFPSSWKFFFDDSPSLYADREVSFKVSNFSRAGLLILKDRDRRTASVIDHFVDEFQIERSPFLTDFDRVSTTIAGFPGEQISWSDNMVGQAEFEFTVIKVQDEPYDAFVIFNFSDEDIAKNDVHKAPFVQSIHLDRSRGLQ